MRLIDADALMTTFNKESEKPFKDKLSVEEIIDDAPTIDAVEVVMCKDCKWYEGDLYGGPSGICFNPNKCTKTLGFEVFDKDYCSYGERND